MSIESSGQTSNAFKSELLARLLTNMLWRSCIAWDRERVNWNASRTSLQQIEREAIYLGLSFPSQFPVEDAFLPLSLLAPLSCLHNHGALLQGRLL